MKREILFLIILAIFSYSCKDNGCPAEMAELKDGSMSFCIDRYENYIIGYDKDKKVYKYEPKFEAVIQKGGKYYPGNIFNKTELKDKIYARSAKNITPVDNISWLEADIACKNAGKRLCNSKEWDFACMGKDNRKYPYGNEYKEDVCNGFEAGKHRGIIDKMPSGSFGKCDNGYGVMDLSGNLWEWIDDTDESKTLKLVKGGGFSNSGYDEDMMSCSKKRFQPPEVRLSGVGFRCCKSK